MTRKEELKKRLLDFIQSGDTIVIMRVGGTAKYKQVEIIVSAERGKPQVVTSWVCGLLGLHRGGKDRNGGLRMPSFHTPQDLAQDIQEALGLTELNFTTY